MHEIIDENRFAERITQRKELKLPIIDPTINVIQDENGTIGLGIKLSTEAAKEIRRLAQEVGISPSFYLVQYMLLRVQAAQAGIMPINPEPDKVYGIELFTFKTREDEE